MSRTGANELKSSQCVCFLVIQVLSRSLVPYQQQHLDPAASDMFPQVLVWAVTHFAD